MVESLGRKIKVLREHSGFTQSNIANYLTVEQNFLAMVEEGKCSLTSEMVDKLGALFFVDMNSFQEADIRNNPALFTLRANELNEEDLDVIASINRIALNSKFMTKLLADDQTSD